MRRVLGWLYPVLIAFCVLSCGNSEKKRLLSEAESLSIDLAAIDNSELQVAVDLQSSLIARYDSLLSLFPTDDDVVHWKTVKDAYQESRSRNAAFIELTHLISQVTDIELATGKDSKNASDSTDSSDQYKELSDYLEVLQEAERSLREFVEDYPEDPLIDSVSSYNETLTFKRQAIEHVAYSLISIDIVMVALLGETTCSQISSTWQSFISAGQDFSEPVNEVASRLKDILTDNGTNQTLKGISDALIIFDPGTNGTDASVKAYSQLEDMYLKAKRLLEMGYKPSGSLTTYNATTNRLISELSSDYNRIELSISKLLKAR